MRITRAAAMALGLACSLPGTALANERRLAFSYESATMPEGSREVELWSTARLGRDERFTSFDERVEFEFGLASRLQTSLYFNFNATSEGKDAQRLEFQGLSSEWKFKISDPVADFIGSAAYAEVEFGPSIAAIEAKAIFDKRMGPLLLATNLTAEQEWAVESGDTNRELTLEVSAGAAYFLTSKFSLGVEGRIPSKFVKGPVEDTKVSALYAGPVASYAEEHWWATLSVTPQLAGLRLQPGATGLELAENEKFNVRLLFSFHL